MKTYPASKYKSAWWRMLVCVAAGLVLMSYGRKVPVLQHLDEATGGSVAFFWFLSVTVVGAAWTARAMLKRQRGES
jgi:hypothetical protein